MNGKRGFTLLEVLVAAAVLGMTATALFGLFSTSLLNLRRVEELHRYELAAEDLMNRVLLLQDLPPEANAEGSLEKTGGNWKIAVRPWAPANLEQQPQNAVLKINVAVTWPGRTTQRSIELEALKPAKVVYSNYDLQKAVESIIPQ